MKYLKRFNEQNFQIEDQHEWKKFLPKKLTIITSNGNFTLETDQNIVVDYGTVMILYRQNTPELNGGDVLADGEPDSLQFDIRFVKDNKGVQSNPDTLRLNVDITYGDAMVSEFTIDAPNKVKPYHYTSVKSLYDPKTMFAFSDDSVTNLVEFFNRFSKNYKLTNKDFNFLDSDPDSYTPDHLL